MNSPAAFIDRVRTDVDSALERLEQRTDPEALYDPVRYVLSGGGKRFRPLLVHCAADMFDGDRRLALAAALGVEVFHCFTLVHDDIMDGAKQRRGRPTVHVKWDEATAILCGDYLHGLSTELLSEFPDGRLRTVLHLHSVAVRELCEGQVRDMEFESRPEVSLDDYLEMIDLKTAALFRLSLKLGALSGTPTPDDLDLLDRIGGHLGRAFQIQDDLLDLTAEAGSWGKAVGGDLVAGKKTWVSIAAASRAESAASDAHDLPIDPARFARALKTPGSFSLEDVPSARDMMDRLGVLNDARSSVIFHSDEARKLLDQLPECVGREVLGDLTHRMQQRYH
ncbi:MAG: polyprenyl synthetase family protein [Rhodothermales bacterium]|nr:polyprenyl synthetase family protein [Rhodothermales bacterium]